MQVNPVLSSVLAQPWLIEPQAAEGLLFAYIHSLKQEPVAGFGLKVKSKKKEQLVAVSLVKGLDPVNSEKSTMVSYYSYDDAPAGSIAVHKVEGAMMRRDNCGTPGTETIGLRIQTADAHPNISGHVIRFGTPGGTVDGTESFANVIKNTSKTLVAYAESMCSAGYWSGSGANLIVVAGQTAGVGSIGTMITLANFEKAYEEIGIAIHNIRATKSIDKNEAYYLAQQGKYDRLRTESLDPINNAFLAAVQENRGDKLDLKKEDVLTGKVYYGQAIIDVGLADEMGSFDYAVRRAMELAGENTSSNQPTNNSEMSLFSKNKFPKMSALAGKEAKDITAEEISAVNDELEAAGISGLTVLSDTQASDLEAASAENATLKASNVKLTSDLATANAEVTRLGAMDGEKPTGSGKKGTELQEETIDTQAVIDALDHNKELANNPMFN